jgi:hypothetical protein
MICAVSGVGAQSMILNCRKSTPHCWAFSFNSSSSSAEISFVWLRLV